MVGWRDGGEAEYAWCGGADMGVYRERAFDREGDVDGVLDLRRGWHATAYTEHADRYPAARRLRLLISSRLYAPERNARVWVSGQDGKNEQDADGCIVGFAMLNQRREGQPSVGLTAIALPEARERGIRSEERRVGKEWRSWWAPYHERKKVR